MGKEPLAQSVAQTRPFGVFGNMANATNNALRNEDSEAGLRRHVQRRPHGYSNVTPVNTGPIEDVTFSRIPAKVILVSHR
jgi:hypothetical protein